jgi:Spy/CpxP family protein refolding chaperone
MTGWRCLADRLNLTPEQRQSLYAINSKYQPTLRDLRQQRSDQRSLLAKMDAADAKLQDTAAAQGKTFADMIVTRKMMRAEMDKVLTDAQRDKLERMLERRWHRRQQHDGMRQG